MEPRLKLRQSWQSNAKIRLLKVIAFTEATVLKTTEATASVASNVATALPSWKT